jgi:hypothetical protein
MLTDCRCPDHDRAHVSGEAALLRQGMPPIEITHPAQTISS